MATAELLPKEKLWGCIAFYIVLGLACFAALSSTLMAQPLFPFQLGNVRSAQTWGVLRRCAWHVACCLTRDRC